MKLLSLHKSILLESKHTRIFVDFDETLAVVPRKDVEKCISTAESSGLEIISASHIDTELKAIMRNGWREFLHNLNSLPNDGIYIYSAGFGNVMFQDIIDKYKDLDFLMLVSTDDTMQPRHLSLSDAIGSHSHSILIDDKPSLSIAKLRVLGLDQVNWVKVKPFDTPTKDNELRKVFKHVKRAISYLERMYQ